MMIALSNHEVYMSTGAVQAWGQVIMVMLHKLYSAFAKTVISTCHAEWSVSL